LPRAIDIAGALLRLYLVLTLACALILRGFGLSAFDATIHALSSVSTGGFSNHDSSFAQFGAGAQYAAAGFMLLASMPFIRFVQLARGNAGPLLHDVQVRAYLRWICYAVALVILYRVFAEGVPFGQAFQQSLFNIVSVFSGTG